MRGFERKNREGHGLPACLEVFSHQVFGFALIREAPKLLFGKDPAVVDVDLENSAARWYKLYSGNTVFVFVQQPFRQTGGSR